MWVFVAVVMGGSLGGRSAAMTEALVVLVGVAGVAGMAGVAEVACTDEPVDGGEATVLLELGESACANKREVQSAKPEPVFVVDGLPLLSSPG